MMGTLSVSKTHQDVDGLQGDLLSEQPFQNIQSFPDSI